MEPANLLSWLKDVFILNCRKSSATKLMIFDGHISHISLEIINFVKDNNVILLCFPPHSNVFSQPLDRGVFRDVKDKWKDVVLEFLKENNFSAIYKDNFPLLMRKVTAKSFKGEIILNNPKVLAIGKTFQSEEDQASEQIQAQFLTPNRNVNLAIEKS